MLWGELGAKKKPWLLARAFCGSEWGGLASSYAELTIPATLPIQVAHPAPKVRMGDTKVAVLEGTLGNQLDYDLTPTAIQGDGHSVDRGFSHNGELMHPTQAFRGAIANFRYWGSDWSTISIAHFLSPFDF